MTHHVNDAEVLAGSDTTLRDTPVRKAVVPKPVRRASYTISQVKHPVSSAWYHLVERPVTTALRSGRRRTNPAPVFMHPGCNVRHRKPETRDRCPNGYPSEVEFYRAQSRSSKIKAPSSARTEKQRRRDTAQPPAFFVFGGRLFLGLFLIAIGLSGPFQDNEGYSVGTVIFSMTLAIAAGIACLRHHQALRRQWRQRTPTAEHTNTTRTLETAAELTPNDGANPKRAAE